MHATKVAQQLKDWEKQQKMHHCYMRNHKQEDKRYQKNNGLLVSNSRIAVTVIPGIHRL